MNTLYRSFFSFIFIPLFSFLTPLLAQAETSAVAAPKNSCLSCHESHVGAKMDCAHCHRGDNRTSRPEIAHRNLIGGDYASFREGSSTGVIRGRQMIKEFGCRRCHVTEGKGNNLAANLDAAVHDRSPAELAEAIRNPASYMPNFGLADSQMIPLVTALLFGGHARTEDGTLPERLLLVHFEGIESGPEQDVFTKNCGSCHRVLTADNGGLGQGEIAPDLSGLLSEFYPALVDGREPWTEKTFQEWMQNPRSKRPDTSMRPIKLDPKEYEKLLQILSFPEQSLSP